MSDKRKISVVVLGTEDSLKKALITIILGKDLAQVKKRNVFTETQIYINDIYEVMCTPDLRKPCEDIGGLFAFDQHHDMCLLVVENDFPPTEVCQQIENLSRTTRIPSEQFKAVLLLSYEHTQMDPRYKLYTIEQVFNELRKLAEDRHLLTNRRYAGQPVPTYTRQTSRNLSQQHLRNHAGTKVNLVLLGMSGTGKSASGNTILGYKYFTSRASSKQVTTECQLVETQIYGRPVRVIDTPDIFDDDIKPSDKDKHVKRCNELCQSDPRVFLLVMQVGRFADGERNVLEKLDKAFGRRAREQTIILFTCGEELQRDGMTLEEFLRSCQPGLKKIIEKCGYRCLTFENRASGSDQVEQLMHTMDRMLKEQQKH